MHTPFPLLLRPVAPVKEALKEIVAQLIVLKQARHQKEEITEAIQ